MSTTPGSAFWTWRYHLLFGAWALGTSVAFLRVSRQPYMQAVKWEQYETIFKGTTLAAALGGIALSGKINSRRSDTTTTY